MKTPLRLLLLSLVAALIGGGVCYWLTTEHTKATVGSRESELEWLRQEYNLDRAQFAAVQELHHQYAPRSEQMYRKIAAADERAERLISASHTVTPELTAALSDCEHIHEECRQAALTQVYAVAGHMAPAEANRYVATMKIRILEPGAAPQITATHWPR